MAIGNRTTPSRALVFAIVAVALLGIVTTGCATRPPVQTHPAPAAPKAPASTRTSTSSGAATTPAPGEPVVETKPASETALLAAKAHAAASVRARQEGDTATAATEEAAARAALESAGLDSETIEMVDLLPEDFENEPAPEEGAEPAPVDEIAKELPQVSDEELERDRELVESSPVSFDFPVQVNPRVLSYVEFFTTRHHDRFGESLERSGMYLDMIQRTFAEAGIPKDLAYMAHVESAFKVTAYSRAKAKGVFQFISETGRRYGLRIDGWVDERSDPEKATRAAAAYLKELYGMFGDWYLALAAYNTGEGRIMRARNRYGPKTFWELADARALHPETRNYVPAILAATLVAKEPAKYGFDIQPLPPMTYDTIPVEGAVHLQTIGKLAGADLDTMKLLNPQFRRQATPPRETSVVRVPLGTGPTTLAALADLPDDQKITQVRHKVRKGDTWTAIARRYGVTVSEIRQENGIRPKTALRAGSTLRIPVAAPPGQTFVAERSEPAPRSKPRSSSSSVTSYRVRSGDTLASIARRNGTTPRAIADASGIGLNSTIKVGQRLRIPNGAVVASAKGKTQSTHASGPAVHTVRRGESLYAIASRYKMTVDEICAMNDITPSVTIYPGKRLNVRSN